VTVRPARPSDEDALQDLLYALSEHSQRLRGRDPGDTHPHERLQSILAQSRDRILSLVVEPKEVGDLPLVAWARYEVDPATHLGEVSFIVADAWQGLGIGTLLLRRLKEAACERGLRGFYAQVPANNYAMLGVFQESGLSIETRLDEDLGVVHLLALFPGAE
jgi:RimJ/RimL family protein N-acetyltransferase